MEWLNRLLKSPVFGAALVGAFGGMSPKLIELLPQLSRNEWPSSGSWLALLLLALFGLVTVVVYGEKNLKKALALGAGAPAIIASLTTTAAAPKETAWLFPVSFSLQEVALAQTPGESVRLKLVIPHNETPFRNNALWLRADATDLTKYWTKGDTVIVDVPSGTKELHVGYPAQTEDLVIKMADIDVTKPLELQITSRQTRKDFWKTFGGVSVPEYQVEKKIPGSK